MEAIQANTTLQILDISYNNVSDLGVLTIIECLKYIDTLMELNISSDHITEEEAKPRAIFIQGNIF